MVSIATTLPPHHQRRLGRLPKRHDVRTLELDKYLPTVLPDTPDVDDWSTRLTDLGPMLNNSIGDCGVAAPGHAEQAWTSQTETQLIIPDEQILTAYKDISGFDGTPATDVGVNMLDVNKYWRTKGIGGKTIKNFSILKSQNHEHVDFAIHAYGGIYGGLNLPLSCQNQAMWGLTPGGTEGDPTPGSWGGHAIWIIGRDKIRRVYKFISWGLLMEMTYDFWDACGDEAYACLSNTDWAEERLAPSGIDEAALENDLVAVAA
jgi:hypothetical protein